MYYTCFDKGKQGGVHRALDFDPKNNTGRHNLPFWHLFSATNLVLKLEHLMQLLLFKADKKTVFKI